MSKTTKEYAEHFNTTERTVQRWKKDGANLDDDEAMSVFTAAKQAAAGSLPPAAKSKKVAPYCISVPVVLEVEGLAGYVERLKAKEKVMSELYDRALEAGDLQSLKTIGQEWRLAGGELRDTEKAHPGILKSNEMSIDKDEMQAVIEAALSSFKFSFSELRHKIAPTLAEMKDPYKIMGFLEKEFEAVLSNLQDMSLKEEAE